jgi:hypothetical protein
MIPTNEQIMAEAKRRSVDSVMTLHSHIIEVVREGWTPAEPVDPDMLAFREWAAKRNPTRETASDIFLAGARMAREGWTPPKPVDPDVLAFEEWWRTEDGSPNARVAYLAGALMAREQERAKGLVEFAKRRVPWGVRVATDVHTVQRARAALARSGREA